MAKRFKRRRDGTVVARVEEAEIDLLARLFSDVNLMLEPEREPERGSTTPSWAAELGLADVGEDREAPTRPEDPALARLLPDARRDDPDGAAEFRRLTERSLRERKRASHDLALGALRRWERSPDEPQVLDPASARAFAAALTDVRLVLADRLGIRTEDDAEALHLRDVDQDDPQDPAAWLAMVYDFTTWLQESLTEAILAGLPDEGDGRRTPPEA